MLISPLGDSAVVIRLGEGVDAKTSAVVRRVLRELERDPPSGMTDVVPAFASVAVYFQEPRACFADVEREIEIRVRRATADGETAMPVVPGRNVEIPVCYGGAFGPDLEAVAQHSRLNSDQVVAAHRGGHYLVHAIGFLPGFPYLGGLPAQLATPRRSTPRETVPAGAVGIGGAQTGVYPIASPGGWNLIGQTPLRLFDVARAEPALLQVGDRVTFREISKGEFAQLKGEARTVSTEKSVSAGEHTAVADGIEVIKAGMMTTVQDLGRVGHRREGVPLSGAVDSLAMRVANLLVGNAENAAGIEFTLVGPELTFRSDTLVALGGGDFGAPRWKPLRIRAGDTLALGAARSGCRGYLAVAGGINVEPVLGSRSTFIRAQLGSWGGRALRAGDVLPVSRVTRRVHGRWRIDPRIIPTYGADVVLRASVGAHATEFDPAWRAMGFRVSPQSDRMGMRLEAASGLVRTGGAELTSMPIAPGTVQVPPDGQPIVLLADAQTIGGYPQLAQVATVDLPLVAQLRPGDTVRFQEISLEDTYDLLNVRERGLRLLRQGLAEKLA